jgi:ATP-binding cassette subfamily A (ABC1) protein 3
LYLIIQFMVLMAFLILWDGGGRPSLAFLRRASKQSQDVEDIASDQDPEVIRETQNVEKSPDSALRVLHLTKSFGANKAVDNVSFSVQQGECFALLGPNGKCDEEG